MAWNNLSSENRNWWSDNGDNGRGDHGRGGKGGHNRDKVDLDISKDGPAAKNLGAGDDVVRVSGDGVQQIRVTFTSADVGNGDALDGANAANEDGGLAIRLQAENGSGGLTGPVSRFDDEGISFKSACRDLTFDVRDLVTGAQRGDQFDTVRLGTLAGDEFDEGNSRDAYYINAGMGNDDVTGGRANDFLVGGAGNDTLSGNRGLDSLLGGGGQDTFAFDTRPEAGGVDKILDFNVADDTIQLDSGVYRGLPEGPLAPGAFASFAAAGQADDRIIYNRSTGELFFDADGGSRDDLVAFADTTPLMGSEPALTAADFSIA